MLTVIALMAIWLIFSSPHTNTRCDSCFAVIGQGGSLRAARTWRGGVTGRSREGRRRGRRVLCAAVQQLEELQGAGELPERGTDLGKV